MSRSRWKFLYFKSFFWKNVFLNKFSKNKNIKKKFKITNKSTRIPKMLLYSYVSVHKGNVSIHKRINKWMIGKRFGEFVFTRKPFFYPIKSKNKR